LVNDVGIFRLPSYGQVKRVLEFFTNFYDLLCDKTWVIVTTTTAETTTQQ